MPVFFGLCQRLLHDPHEAEDALPPAVLLPTVVGGFIRGRGSSPVAGPGPSADAGR
jgi:hypothetical protein